MAQQHGCSRVVMAEAEKQVQMPTLGAAVRKIVVEIVAEAGEEAGEEVEAVAFAENRSPSAGGARRRQRDGSWRPARP